MGSEMCIRDSNYTVSALPSDRAGKIAHGLSHTTVLDRGSAGGSGLTERSGRLVCRSFWQSEYLTDFDGAFVCGTIDVDFTAMVRFAVASLLSSDLLFVGSDAARLSVFQQLRFGNYFT